MIDESAHKVFGYGMKNWHGFCTHKCSHCSRQLDIYYCESRLYLVRCKHCKIVSLVEAGNPNEAAEKVSRCSEPENKPLTLKQLRQMNGEPVWIYQLPETFGAWRICNGLNERKRHGKLTINFGGAVYENVENYGKTWIAYARKPEGSKKS